ncbi:hypothetical protein OM427_30875 [Halomonas sp. 18H]|nr:hypothetical protein [Halomonas sp. 18H]MCW4153904.1 hypothetical protein [Halomonas sp. 18H]
MAEKFVPLNLGKRNKLARLVWYLVWVLLYRPTPRPLHAWRCFLLKSFGAKLGRGVHPYPSSKVWAPWNLTMEDHACLSEHVDCYNVAPIHIGTYSTVSQYSFLCSASHDYSKASMPLVVAPISIGERVWITADVFVGPGVIIGDGCVVTARSTVLQDLPVWQVAKGNPAIPFKARRFHSDL